RVARIMKKFRAAVFPALFVCLALSGCSRDSSVAPSTETEAGTVEQQAESIENFHLKQMRGGKVAWELVAGRARFITADEVALDDPVLSIPHTEGGSGSGDERDDKKSALSIPHTKGGLSVIRASRGRVIMSTSEIHTYGPTNLRSPDKTVRATDITYNPSEDKISTDKSVVIVTQNSQITGDSMVSDSRLETITLTNQRVKWTK
ncbi:MAG: LPS export ABC transporter periplasmic protein LptC, partial [Endomicrobiia bacterium]|nr:LPS export ABC transporter periplasmic protein LptC [Endomicrobiia bacterium]